MLYPLQDTPLGALVSPLHRLKRLLENKVL